MKKFLTLVILVASVFVLSERSYACDCDKKKDKKTASCDKKSCGEGSCKEGASCSEAKKNKE